MGDQPGAARCKFCHAERVVRNGKRKGVQYWLCRECGKTFGSRQTIPGMRYPVPVVAFTLTSYCRGWGIDSIRKYAQRRFGVTPSNPTIHTWVARFSSVAKQVTEKHRPSVGDEWITEEVRLTVGGETRQLGYIVDTHTRFVLAMRYGGGTSEPMVISLLKRAFARAGKTPRSLAASRLDALLNLPDKIGGWSTGGIGVRPLVAEFTGYPVGGSLLSVEEVVRVTEAMRSPDNTEKAIDAWLVYHNFLHPQDELGQRTPAESAGIELPYHTWLELLQDWWAIKGTGSRVMI